MNKKFILLTMLLLLSACSEQETNEAAGAEENPQIPPLTYTWSYPDCPFTVDFPSEPEVVVENFSHGAISYTMHYQLDDYSLMFRCDSNVLKTVQNRSDYSIEELAKQYASIITEDPIFSDSRVYMLPADHELTKQGVILAFSGKLQTQNIAVYQTALVFYVNDTFATAVLSGIQNETSFANSSFARSIKRITN